jgi:carboxyl-terminal processing protease
MFKRIISIGLGVIAGYLMTLGVVQVVQAWGWWPDRATDRAAAQVREVMLLANKHYVDADAVGAEQLAEHALSGLTRGLDPYSEFLRPTAFRSLEEEIESKFGGIGVQVEEVDGRIVVVAPIAGTPGERAGILRGDALVKVDGADVRGLKLDQFIGRLRGKPGTEVTVTIERGAPARELEYRLKRELIRVESVRDAQMLADGLGYVRLSVFAEKTGDEFAAAVKKLRAEGLRALVVDLRNNPGGLLTAAVAVAEVFFPEGELIVYTEGRAKTDRVELRAGDGGERLTMPVAILVNGGSASAAEIVAGAMRDTRRAVLVGEKTFGKGSVQTIFPLSDGAGLRLTTARYYTPSGASIHKKGIAPDLTEPMTPEEEKAVFLARLRPDIIDPAAFQEKFGVPPAEDKQLAAAVRELQSELAGGAPTRRPGALPADADEGDDAATASTATPAKTEAVP